VLDVGVDDGGDRSGGDAGDAADEGEQDRFGQELRADVPSRGAEGAAEADLGAPFEDADQHDVGDADGAHEE
jgi:hypothetical protein